MKYIVSDAITAARIADMVRGLNCDGKQWDVEIKQHKKQRTLRANNLYWQWLTIIGRELGYTKDEMHDVFREAFLPWTEEVVCGVRKKTLAHTSAPDFSTAMMSEYMSQIDMLAARDLGILLPRPEDDAYTEWARAAGM